MGGGWHRDGHTVRLVEQRFQRLEGPDAKLGRHLSRAIRPRVEESHQLGAGHIAKNADVMIPEGARTDHAQPNARCHLLRPQMTSPRSLRSKKLRNSSTSGYRWSSLSARSLACERFRSELK